MSGDREYKRRVVCAANLLPNGRVVIGVRHMDPFMRLHSRLMNAPKHQSLQGFIDQHGVWMDRREAWKVAEAAGQINYRCGGDSADGGTLYSENLY